MIVIIDYKVKDRTLQSNINRQAAKISALPSRKIDKYEYLTGLEILCSNQERIMEQPKSTFLFWEKFWKNKQNYLRIKEKQFEPLKTFKLSNQHLAIKYIIHEIQLSKEPKDELENIKKKKKIR